MHPFYYNLRLASSLLPMAFLLLCGAAPQIASAQSSHERRQLYQQDRQLCLSGQTSQSEDSCLREAGAAMQQNMAAQNQTSVEQMAANAVQRCDAFTGDARHSCMARMQGQGSVHGSVAAGGILRELSEPAQ